MRCAARTSIDGVPWSEMAVIVRSVPRAGASLARALAASGVPVDQPSATALAEHPAVAALLTVLDATIHGLDGDRAASLVTGPIGRVDPVSLRQLRRALRRADGSQPPREFADLLVGALEGAQKACRTCPISWPGRCAGSPRCSTRPAVARRVNGIRASPCGRRGTRAACNAAG